MGYFIQFLINSNSYCFVNKLFGLVMALNSKLLFDGSLRNIVHCSPGLPSNRMCGSTINLTLCSFNLSFNLMN